MKEITISGYIGWDTTADSVRVALKEAAGADVTAIISTPGGLVSEGLDIFNQFRNYPGKTVAVLSGFAMSMGSYIPLAFDEVHVEDNAIYMIHNVHGGIWGDHNDILDYGEFCKGLSGLLGKAYAKRSGEDAAMIAAMMDKETYLFGEDIVEMGFADKVIEASTDDDQETALATARMAMESCVAKLNQEAEATKNDLRQAARMTGMLDLTNHKSGSPKRSEPANEEEVIMTLSVEKLRADHSDLVTAIEAAATTGMIKKDTAETAKATAVSAEAEALMALVTVAVGEETAKRLSMAHSKGLSAEDLQEMGISLAVAADTNSTEQQMLDAITTAAAAGVRTGSARDETPSAAIDTASIYASRQEQICATGR